MGEDSFKFIPFRDGDRRYLPLVVVLALLLAGLLIIFGVVYRPEAVSGDSMMQTLQSGDRLLVTRGYPRPARGDVVSADIVLHGDPDRILKRVVAVAGDTVEVFGDQVVVNGETLTWPGVIIGATDDFHLGPFVIPEGNVYLMGDNRPVSLDSRYIGAVPVSAITGKVVAVFSPITHAGRID